MYDILGTFNKCVTQKLALDTPTLFITLEQYILMREINSCDANSGYPPPAVEIRNFKRIGFLNANEQSECQ